MYACGYKDKDDDLSSYGMFAGPSPNLEDMLDIVPQEDTRRAYVIRFNVNGTDDELYRWNPLKEVWRRIGR
jgi:hypothetical protein